MRKIISILLSLALPASLWASEADLKMPENFGSDPHTQILYWGFLVVVLGMLFGCYQFMKVRKLGAHKSMLEIGNVIFKTCSTYLKQQGKFLAVLFLFIGLAVLLYFKVLDNMPLGNVLVILGWTVVGVLGSYAVAWYGVRMNTYANARMAFASLRRKPLALLNIPLTAGMSIGVVLICVELVLMLAILLFVPGDLAGSCFIGFAIGESLGASALRIAGGIFTKIADIGSDLMKVVFKIGEDDPRNPGVIADCTGDNAGDSIGPTADGFETYGVTGVALVSFILLAIKDPAVQVQMLVWIFVMRILGVLTSVIAYYVNNAISKAKYNHADDMDFEKPLTCLVWITSILSIVATFVASYFCIKGMGGYYWLGLSCVISCGTLGAALIPEVTKLYTSPTASHVKEVVNTSRQGGASLNILSGLVSGNFGSFWTGFMFFLLMLVAYLFALQFDLKELFGDYGSYSAIFAFGLVAFGMLGMGPVTIAVDSYGPVTDNAQSVYELSLIEDDKTKAEAEIEQEFGFKPDWEKAKHYLEANDGAGNTFKATAKPVLIGTAVAGATTMIFSLILMIQQTLQASYNIDSAKEVLNLLNPYAILGFILGGCVVYWFTGSSMQAVTTGANRAVAFIKDNIKLDANAPKKADISKSQEVVKICTEYAQKGMINIFISIFCFALGFACLSSPESIIGGPNATCLFISYLVSIAVFGLFQAVFMADAGGAWDNAKKIVEVDLEAKGTPLHDATVVGDTVGDPYKDTSSVALNPIIKFTTLFGVLAMEIAISDSFRDVAPYFGIAFVLIGLYFVYRSFYKMMSKDHNKD
ncbi:sodium-translocating pyrophosphatase [Sodaliphilus pleomorphus]|uniref:K(+)-insensitive pyrophosphate-energized proton pump n=1 Tax=Sodaliphilus pleomorphus TaxID=2606626 RepID=A0A6L5XFY2_9BACT|nr:sodium-translocating pyrophosphatase [Sodaliphilus pleomorphus]MDY6253317.1 sodium-translocating pyrophosphatase [Bacteroidales bacterium]MSS18413.1 sodium-translocating pyrophosphatase [Sodaliphilus pleomorphus]